MTFNLLTTKKKLHNGRVQYVPTVQAELCMLTILQHSLLFPLLHYNLLSSPLTSMIPTFTVLYE